MKAKYDQILNIKFIFVFGFIISAYQLNAQDWIWLDGSNEINGEANYAEIVPGAREGSSNWKDNNGDLWLFGGFADVGNRLNDLWKYNISADEWIWISGSNLSNQNGHYGTKGIPSASNIPGARYFSVSWKDNNGDLWLFGGLGYHYGSLGQFNDLWKYNISSDKWTWISGSNTLAQSSVYGVKGIPSSSNMPGARNFSISWTDDAGNLWLFGGSAYDVNGSGGKLNDLWKYDIANDKWTWMSGSNTIDQNGVYGTKGISSLSNIPGARNKSICWKDSNGDFWLFGGNGYDFNNDEGILNDLWKYDISNNRWIWVGGPNTIDQAGVYGTKGIPSSSNIPGARERSISWEDGNGNLWLFGGKGYRENTLLTWDLNDLWKYDISADEWTWVGGANTFEQNGEYGTKGTPSPANIPGVRRHSISWEDNNGSLWLFGGYGYADNSIDGKLNDLWKYNISTNQWTWVSGSDEIDRPGEYDALPISYPGAREKFYSAQSDNSSFWIFGGNGLDKNESTGLLNDLWKFDGLNWHWVKGENTKDQPGIYGNLGQPSPSNYPGSRKNGAFHATSETQILLFGGYGYDKNGNQGWLNDIWFYNISTDIWFWGGGSEGSNKTGIYDNLGSPSPLTKPGGRENVMSWVTFENSQQKFWIFGGLGFGESSVGLLNDLFYYDGNEWAWMKGSSNPGAPGNYEKGSSSIPGARSGATTWIDDDGYLWLFGGNGYDKSGDVGPLNDLWLYDPASNQFTWMGGSNVRNQIGKYSGSQSDLQPGGRYDAKGWVDSNGDFWLFGGFGYAESNLGRLNDLWKYDVSTGLWTFVKGSTTTNETAEHGSQNTPAASNTPGSTYSFGTWKDDQDNLYLFGGFGHDENNSVGFLNSFWKFGVPFLEIDLMTLLEGPYDSNNLMNHSLDLSSQLTHPYTSIHSGNETVSSNFFSIHPDIVDWIVVELRTGTAANSKVSSRAAFLKYNGSIVDIDGFSPVRFNDISSGNYYVVVYHRNHLPIMSANAVLVQ